MSEELFNFGLSFTIVGVGVGGGEDVGKGINGDVLTLQKQSITKTATQRPSIFPFRLQAKSIVCSFSSLSFSHTCEGAFFVSLVFGFYDTSQNDVQISASMN